MARTNKMGILKKKQQQAKQKQLMSGSESEGETDIKKDFTNPKGNNYIRFLRGAKFVCDKTSFREDPDGYRVVRKANGGEIDFEFKGESAWGFRRWRKKARKLNR